MMRQRTYLWSLALGLYKGPIADLTHADGTGQKLGKINLIQVRELKTVKTRIRYGC